MSLKNKKVKYTVSPSSLKGYREVYINYSHKGKDYKQLTYVKDNPKFKEKDYIRQAKKQFKPNFKVQAQPKAYFHFPVIPVVASLVIAGGLGTGGYFTYKYFSNTDPTPPPPTPTEKCNVSFNTDHGSYVPMMVVDKGKPFDAPEDPVKKVDDFNYTFDGWFLDDTPFDFTKGTEVDITLTAHWSGEPPLPPEYCIVNFDSAGGDYVPSKRVLKGVTFDAPPTPKKIVDGFEFTFGGWFLNDEQFDFTKDTITENNTTLTAHWVGVPPEYCIVSFDSNGGNYIPAITVEKNKPFAKPETDPTKTEGDFSYKFEGWFIKEGTKERKFVFNQDTVSESTVLYAHWSGSPTKYYLVSFDGVGCTGYTDTALTKSFTSEMIKEYSAFTVYISPNHPEGSHFEISSDIKVTINGKPAQYGQDYTGGKVPPSVIPSDDCYYISISQGEKTGIRGETRISAIATEYCRVDFQPDEEEIEDILVKRGEKIERPEDPFDPTMPYRTFLGWYHSDGERKFDFENEQIFSDTVIIAKFAAEDDYLHQPLTFTCTTDTEYASFSIAMHAYSDSTDTTTRNLFYRIATAEGEVGTWNPIADADSDGNFDVNANTNIDLLEEDIKVGDRIQFRGNNEDGFGNDTFTFSFDVGDGYAFSVSGNVMSLVSISDYYNLDEIPSNHCFDSLFAPRYRSCAIVDSKNLILPAKILKPYCYSYMFATSYISNTPTLQATVLEPYCCYNMFYGCTNLVTASDLPATHLAESCYCCMFEECGNLKNAPALPAEALVEACYDGMFVNCVSLISAPDLPAYTLAPMCYYEMFSGCTHLESLKVGFGFGVYDNAWPISDMGTDDWLLGAGSQAANTPQFYWKARGATIPWSRDSSHVPSNWNVSFG